MWVIPAFLVVGRFSAGTATPYCQYIAVLRDGGILFVIVYIFKQFMSSKIAEKVFYPLKKDNFDAI
jgi:hypothetical protein